MRRRDVPPEEMPRIVALRQGNASWLKIQRETGIPRRTARRAYEEWQRNQARAQLNEARKEVAAEEFRQHLDLLSQMADSLIGILRVPSSAEEVSKAENLLASLWQRDMSPSPVPSEFTPPREVSDRNGRRSERHNRMVFRSLQDHTRGKIRWEALEEWKLSWDDSVSLLSKLRKQASEVMDGYLKQKPGLRERVAKETKQKDAVYRMVDVVMGVVWRGDCRGESQTKAPLFRSKEQGENLILVVTNWYGGLPLTFGDKKVAQEVAVLCDLAAQNLLRTQSETIAKIGQELASMGKVIEELEGMLDPLRLRPLILSSRCELCPA